MPTVAEVLKSTGLDDAAIAALDANAVKAFQGVLTTAEQERQAGELAMRSAEQMFENDITPALNAWGQKEANLTAERDYYKTLAEKAKTGGFIPEAPPFTQPRNTQGEFVAQPGKTGSPDMSQFEDRVVGAIGNLADLQWQYRTLYGTEMPDAPTALGAEAGRNRMSMADWAAKKYNFEGKRAEQAAARQKEHDDAIRKEVTEAKDREYAERYAAGADPNNRRGLISNFPELKKAVSEGTRVDPIKMTREQRHQATASAIRTDIAATVN
jgi:hypothetical protein